MSDEEIGAKEPREKIHLEVKPFNKEQFNQAATFNQIDNGSLLPIKLDQFPKQLLGLPIYDLGPRPNEKVSSRLILFHNIIIIDPDILCCLITV